MKDVKILWLAMVATSLVQVHGAQAQGNHISGTTGTGTNGIRTFDSADNLVVRNSCIGHTDNFSLDVDDTFGPEITTSGTLGSTDPWANFSF